MGSLLLRVIKSFGMGFDTSCEDDGGNCEVSRIQIYIYIYKQQIYNPYSLSIYIYKNCNAVDGRNPAPVDK